MQLFFRVLAWGRSCRVLHLVATWLSAAVTLWDVRAEDRWHVNNQSVLSPVLLSSSCPYPSSEWKKNGIKPQLHKVKHIFISSAYSSLQNHRIIEWSRFKNASKITEPHHYPSTSKLNTAMSPRATSARLLNNSSVFKGMDTLCGVNVFQPMENWLGLNVVPRNTTQMVIAILNWRTSKSSNTLSSQEELKRLQSENDMTKSILLFYLIIVTYFVILVTAHSLNSSDIG